MAFNLPVQLFLDRNAKNNKEITIKEYRIDNLYRMINVVEAWFVTLLTSFLSKYKSKYLNNKKYVIKIRYWLLILG